MPENLETLDSPEETFDLTTPDGQVGAFMSSYRKYKKEGDEKGIRTLSNIVYPMVFGGVKNTKGELIPCGSNEECMDVSLAAMYNSNLNPTQIEKFLGNARLIKHSFNVRKMNKITTNQELEKQREIAIKKGGQEGLDYYMNAVDARLKGMVYNEMKAYCAENKLEMPSNAENWKEQDAYQTIKEKKDNNMPLDISEQRLLQKLETEKLDIEKQKAEIVHKRTVTEESKVKAKEAGIDIIKKVGEEEYKGTEIKQKEFKLKQDATKEIINFESSLKTMYEGGEIPPEMLRALENMKTEAKKAGLYIDDEIDTKTQTFIDEFNKSSKSVKKKMIKDPDFKEFYAKYKDKLEY